MPPFTVLHVCMGNICRSPMAERLLTLRVNQIAGDEDLVYSHSCGIGLWHVGERMNPPAARELRSRGGTDAGFKAQHIARDLVEASDVILTATDEQYEYIAETFPDALPRTFLLRHFGRLAAGIDPNELPVSDGSAAAVHARGVALVAAADRRRDSQDAENLDDPWGESPAIFRRIGDEIDEALKPVVAALLS
ncbi:low molecular weight phosphotyrosine protein phosphatase [Stackebrandtia nassauensis]|uniref:Protein tyrosine phosphatase n=1 Tax=Stackebrandtia nassauensis (strain DSM 44728 / CIP 108903 / NRRL B-16338 / NBRC 102104 / LLR-40K-21) TaxID=446470 RepID=D3PU71_STANL|nr:low molecular weight phosphotyrosine protein phosphatase [Stackebrandtia nassauensis]ADD41017.1 protein tyrosine phosphatase [Stackebrandtia nassauensis DSM 44728]